MKDFTAAERQEIDCRAWQIIRESVSVADLRKLVERI